MLAFCLLSKGAGCSAFICLIATGLPTGKYDLLGEAATTIYFKRFILLNRKEKMPADKQEPPQRKIKCFKLRFSGLEQCAKAPECPASSELEKRMAEMLKARAEQDKKLFGPK